MTRLALVVIALAATSAAADFAVAERLGFSEGVRPLVVDAGDLGLSAASCKECHRAEHEAWARSRHAISTTNALFRQGHKAEPRRRCVGCHAPLREQQAAVRAGRTQPGSLAEEGVNCAACHIRGGAILTPGPLTDKAREAHPMKREPALSSSTFCGACHQFRFQNPKTRDLTGAHAQLTLDEHTAWTETGKKASCQRCHMPKGDHAFLGSHDDALLRDALEVALTPGKIALRTRNVGHRFPSGDVYRHLTVEVSNDGRWTEVHRIGLVLGFEKQDGAAVRTRASDNRLHPGELRELPLPTAERVRVVYRFTTARNVERGKLPPEVAERVLFEQNVQSAGRSNDR